MRIGTEFSGTAGFKGSKHMHFELDANRYQTPPVRRSELKHKNAVSALSTKARVPYHSF
ncbi:MAG: hypothetical protein WBN92_15990 [Terriglobia bacterium]